MLLISKKSIEISETVCLRALREADNLDLIDEKELSESNNTSTSKPLMETLIVLTICLFDCIEEAWTCKWCTSWIH